MNQTEELIPLSGISKSHYIKVKALCLQKQLTDLALSQILLICLV